MDTYNPLQPPDATAWLALDQQHRISLIEAHHKARNIDIPGLHLHVKPKPV